MAIHFHKEKKDYEFNKHYEIDPNSKLRQVCRLHGLGSWTQRERVRVVRRFPVGDGGGGCFGA
jgi:hypothetical protein